LLSFRMIIMLSGKKIRRELKGITAVWGIVFGGRCFSKKLFNHLKAF